MGWYEADNFVYGNSKNPWDPSRSSGGSSGGDAGITALRGSAISICNDLAGSIRVPAHWCGIYGFMPTPARVSYFGSISSHPMDLEMIESMTVLDPSQGPYGRCVDDLIPVTKVMIGRSVSDRDCTVSILEFRENLY